MDFKICKQNNKINLQNWISVRINWKIRGSTAPVVWPRSIHFVQFHSIVSVEFRTSVVTGRKKPKFVD